MKTWKVVLVAAALAGCGPSAQQRRACEMYVEADGGKPETVESWVPYYESRTAEDEKDLKKQAREDAVHEFVNELNQRKVKVEEIDAFVKGAVDRAVLPSARERAQQHIDWQKERNTNAAAAVALRLTLSLREVYEALAACGPR